MRQIHLLKSLVELTDHVGAPFAGHRGIGLQLLLGLGHHIAQPDRILGVFGLPAVCGRQHRHGRIGARAPELGEG